MSTFREIWSNVVSQIQPMLKTHSANGSEINQSTNRYLALASEAPIDDLLHDFKTSKQGLNFDEIEIRRDEFGKNIVAQEKAKSWFVLLFENFKNPFIGVLFVLGIVSYLTDDLKGTIVVSIMVVVSVIMRFLQEYKSSKEAEALKAMVTTTASVIRSGKKVEISFEDVHTVGFLGDGINDAPALRQADVGISVDTATDIAKESADIILLEKNLLVLESGVIKGREVYGNIIKYIKMTASSNFGNVFSVLVASAFIPFLPMLSVHLLVQNLLYDFSQTALPWDHMDPEFLEKPKKWDPSGISKFMIFIGPISSIFDIMTFLIMWFVFKANSSQAQSLFQSGWFIEGLLSQTLIVHMIRTQKIPFVQSAAAWPVVVTTATIMAIGIIIPFSPIGHSIGLVSLPMNYFLWLGLILTSYCFVTQFIKNWYIHKFKVWL